MSDFGSLTHSRWDCKYHVVFIPKYRKKKLFGQVRRYLRTVFHELAQQKDSKIVEGHMMTDHVHMCISIPPKYSVAQVIGYVKGKSAIAVARHYGGRKRNFNGRELMGSKLCYSLLLTMNLYRAHFLVSSSFCSLRPKASLNLG